MTSTARSLCKYIWEVILFMVLIGKVRLGPDIWPETPDHAKIIEDMMRIV